MVKQYLDPYAIGKKHRYYLYEYKDIIFSPWLLFMFKTPLDTTQHQTLISQGKCYDL